MIGVNASPMKAIEGVHSSENFKSGRKELVVHLKLTLPTLYSARIIGQEGN